MKYSNLHYAKTHLSSLVELVIQGERVVLCKANKPIAELVPFINQSDSVENVRKPNLFKNDIKIANDFDELPDSFINYFRGE